MRAAESERSCRPGFTRWLLCIIISYKSSPCCTRYNNLLFNPFRLYCSTQNRVCHRPEMEARSCRVATACLALTVCVLSALSWSQGGSSDTTLDAIVKASALHDETSRLAELRLQIQRDYSTTVAQGKQDGYLPPVQGASSSASPRVKNKANAFLY